MQAREILVANTKTQKRSKITTDAETLGQLKQAFNAAGIDYTDMTFTEGITKTQLLSDDSPLPREVMHKGQLTNNLVILLTNTKNKIASGQDRSRKEAYAIIKAYNLLDDIKEEYGYNYTNIATSDLWDFIDENVDFDEDENDVHECGCTQETPQPSIGLLITHHICMMVSELCEQKFLTESDLECFAKDISNITAYYYPAKVSSSDGKISNEDINDMIDEIQG